MTAAAPAFAAVDWGTTRFRAWLLDAAGEVVAERRSDEGLLSLSREKFGDVLEGHLAEMGADGSLPVVICGMAGSRQGWIEAPYADTPVRLDDVPGMAVSVPGTRRDVRIIPGIAQRDPEKPDVMRGEETQLAGIASLAGSDDLLVCMPGTHCKWVDVTKGVVAGFTTWMTGELFAVLSQHSILKHAVGAAPVRVSANDPVFGTWLDDGLAHPEDASSRLFRIRASTLLAGMEPAQAAAALSGLLIGSEVASAKGTLRADRHEVVLVGAGPLGALYTEALQRAEFAVRTADGEIAVRRGLFEAGRSIFGLARSKA